MFWTPLCQTCRHYAVLLSKCYDSATASCSPIQLLIGAIQLYNLSDTIPWEKPKSMGLCLKVESLKKKKNISNILDTSWHICFLSVDYLFIHVVHVSHIYIYVNVMGFSPCRINPVLCRVTCVKPKTCVSRKSCRGKMMTEVGQNNMDLIL